MTDRARRTTRHRDRPGRLGKLLLAVSLLLAGAFIGVLTYVGLSGGIDLDALLADKPPAQPANGKPKYSFYDDLPRPPTAAPKAEDAADGSAPAVPPIALISRQPEQRPTPSANAGGDYIVQAGAFARRSDADRRKASLALLGVQAVIERGEVEGGEVYRVRIGPFASAEQAKSLRQRLEQDNIQSFTIKRE